MNFCAQRPNQNTMNGWLMKLIEEKLLFGIKILKIGETAEKFFKKNLPVQKKSRGHPLPRGVPWHIVFHEDISYWPELSIWF